jgi:hypothetical protein
MEPDEAMRTQHACRYYRDDPVPDEVVYRERAQGVATTVTTLLVAREPDVKKLLGIPGHMATACHIVAGYPARPFPRRLHRPEASRLAFADRYGNGLAYSPACDA